MNELNEMIEGQGTHLRSGRGAKRARSLPPTRWPSGEGVSLLTLVLAVCLTYTFTLRGGTTNSWRVFQSLANGASTGGNRVGNPGMETPGSGQPLAVWSAYGSGYVADTNNAHTGSRSLECIAVAPTDVHGGYQTITLNQTTPKAIKLSGWSKALGVTGSSDSDYSVYLDIIYTDGSPLWGQTIDFSVGTHDWEYKESYILPALPIRSLTCYVLFRNSHTGTVWFDDVAVAEVLNTVAQFDGGPVIASAPVPLPFNPTNRFTLLSGDGLQLQVTQDGGVIEAVADGTNSVFATGADYASGWFICDRGTGSDWWNAGGSVTSSNGGLLQHGVVTGLNLTLDVGYSVTNNAIRMQATVSNLFTADRALSIYFALPVAMSNGFWWNSPRVQTAVTGAVESATLTSVALGALDLVSQYPLATLAGTAALTLAVPPDQYRPFRLVYNRVTQQFFAVFDIGVSGITSNFPQSATVELWLFRSDPAWGMRSGLAGIYRCFPAAYAKAFTNEGIWVAFADIRSITNISDFNIAYHEISYTPAFVEADDTNGIGSFRYVSEPWSYWMIMPTNIANTNYTSVYNYLASLSAGGTTAATATLSSGIRDLTGALVFSPAAQPWCPYGAVFDVNASPGISNPPYSTTKFNNEWNSTVKDVYNHPENGILDGEYIDSFSAAATEPDYSTNHLRTTTFPLTYTHESSALMTPLILGTVEMARAIGSDVHALGKAIIGNGLYPSWPTLPIGMGLFDFSGCEINWFDASGNFVQPDDNLLLFARALSGARPYGYLMNTDFTKVSQAEMEEYMRLCAVYAIYPSAFSADAANNNYFEQPALYERDRPLFKKYVPVIRALSLAGWQPVPYATVDNPSIGLEAYGTNAVTGNRFLTLRNLGSNAVSANVTFDTNQWAFAGAQWLRFTNVFDGGGVTNNLVLGSNSIAITLAPYQCAAYAVQAGPGPTPVIYLNDGALGFHGSMFGFDIGGIPGQVVVVEGTTNLVNWTALQTNVIPNGGVTYFSDSSVAGWLRRFYRARSLQ